MRILPWVFVVFFGSLLLSGNSLYANGETLYAPLRNKLRYLLPDESAAVFFSGIDMPVWNTPEGSHFYRMTGVNAPNCILILLPKKVLFKGNQVQEILFVLPQGQWNAFWTGPEHNDAYYSQLSGIQTIASLDELPMFLDDLIRNQWASRFLFTQYPAYFPHAAFHESYEKALGNMRIKLKLPFAWTAQLDYLYQEIQKTPAASFDVIRKKAAGYLSYYPEIKNDLLIHDFAKVSSASDFVRLKSEAQQLRGNITLLPSLMEQLREKRMPEELELLKASARQTVRYMDEWIRAVQPDIISHKLQAAWPILHGQTCMPYAVSHGVSALYADGQHLSGKLITGELVRLSGGIRVSGYGVVYERTIPASGKYTQEQKNLVNALLKAQDLAMKMIRPGVRNSEIHEVMQNSLASSLKELGLLKQTSDIHKFVFRQMVSHNAISEFESDPDYPLEAGAVLNLSPAVFIFPTTSVPKAYAGLAVAVSDAVVVSSTGADFLDHTLARTTGELELRTAEPSILDPILK